MTGYIREHRKRGRSSACGGRSEVGRNKTGNRRLPYHDIANTGFRPRVRVCARGAREQKVYEPRLEAAL